MKETPLRDDIVTEREWFVTENFHPLALNKIDRNITFRIDFFIPDEKY